MQDVQLACNQKPCQGAQGLREPGCEQAANQGYIGRAESSIHYEGNLDFFIQTVLSSLPSSPQSHRPWRHICDFHDLVHGPDAVTRVTGKLRLFDYALPGADFPGFSAPRRLIMQITVFVGFSLRNSESLSFGHQETFQGTSLLWPSVKRT